MVNAPDGIAMINPTAVGGEEWYLFVGGQPTDDQRFNSAGELEGNATDGFSVTDDFALLTIETSSGYNSGSIIKDVDHAFVASTGYMFKSNDWRDVEITGIFNFANVSSDNDFAKIQLRARGAEVGNARPWCPGTFYGGELTVDGQFRWIKGQYHLSHIAQDWLDKAHVGLTDNLRNIGWFGFKITISNIDIGEPGQGKEGVRLRAYVDKDNNNNWVEIVESDYRDLGGWGFDGSECGGNPDQIITWGGPLAGFKFDWGSKIKFLQLSVREIDEGASFLDPRPTRQAPQFAITSSRVLSSTTHRYRIGTFQLTTCAGEVVTDPDPPTDPNNPPPVGTHSVMKRIAQQFEIKKARSSVDSVTQVVSVTSPEI